MPLVRVVLGVLHPAVFVALALAVLAYGIIFCRYDHPFWLTLVLFALLIAFSSTSLMYRRKFRLSSGSFVAARAMTLGYWLGLLLALCGPLQPFFPWTDIATGGLFIGHWAGYGVSKMAERNQRN